MVTEVQEIEQNKMKNQVFNILYVVEVIIRLTTVRL